MEERRDEEEYIRLLLLSIPYYSIIEILTLSLITYSEINYCLLQLFKNIKISKELKRNEIKLIKI